MDSVGCSTATENGSDGIVERQAAPQRDIRLSLLSRKFLDAPVKAKGDEEKESESGEIFEPSDRRKDHRCGLNFSPFDLRRWLGWFRAFWICWIFLLGHASPPIGSNLTLLSRTEVRIPVNLPGGATLLSPFLIIR